MEKVKKIYSKKIFFSGIPTSMLPGDKLGENQYGKVERMAINLYSTALTNLHSIALTNLYSSALTKLYSTARINLCSAEILKCVYVCVSLV